MAKTKKVKELKIGEWFTLKPYEYPTDMQVYVRDEYVRGDKKFMAYKYGDVCYSRLFPGDKEVYVDFVF